jgi:hypothetical protein
MMVEIKRTNKQNMVEVYYKDKFLGDMIYDISSKLFGISVDGDTYWDFTSKEKAIGKMIHYYGLV